MKKLGIVAIICCIVPAVLISIAMTPQPIYMSSVNNEDKSATVFIEWQTENQIACSYSTSADFVKKPLPLTSMSSERSGYDAVTMTFSDRESIAIDIDCKLNTGEQKSHRINAD